MVEIKELLPEQKQDLMDFLREWCPDHPELSKGDIFDWIIADNFVALNDGKIVGYLSHLHQNVIRGGETFKVGWGTSIVINMSDNDIRKQAGRGLLTKAEENLPYFGVGIIPTIVEPYKRRGHFVRDDGSMMYARFLQPKRALQFLGMNKALAIPLKIINLVFRMHTPPRPMENISTITSFDKAHDPIWEKYLKEHEMYGERTAEYLNHKLKQPDRDYSCRISKSRVTGEVDGYIIWRFAKHGAKDLSVFKICDLVGSETAKRNLLLTANLYLKESGRKPDSIIAMSSKKDRHIYRYAGMYLAKPYLYMTPPRYDSKMHITFFDSDLDNLW